MKMLETTSEMSNLSQVKAFICAELETTGLAKDVLHQIRMAVEEIFVNISEYGYDNSAGPVTISAGTDGKSSAVLVKIADSGLPFDPLENKSPDLTVPIAQRRKGGLGIFMVRRVMDEVSYEYKDGQNILTMIKYI